MKMRIAVRVEATVRVTQNQIVEVEVDNPQELEQKAFAAALDNMYAGEWQPETPRREQVQLYSLAECD